jgi:hypothetical protein
MDPSSPTHDDDDDDDKGTYHDDDRSEDDRDHHHHNMESSSFTPQPFMIQIKDFENIHWDAVLQGTSGASSYLVRKGLSRKAQLSLQLKRYCSKHPLSVLHQAVPMTIIVETWNAYEEMKLDFGGGIFASFDDDHHLIQAPLRDRLCWCLHDVKQTIESDEYKDLYWILKSSVTNKGYDISIIKTWDELLQSLEASSHIREWVLQRYIERPLLVMNHKFHLRVYVLCVGALRVFVYNQILMLIAAHPYSLSDYDDIYSHLTNTARSAEDIDFDEVKFVRHLDDLSPYLLKYRPDICNDTSSSIKVVDGIKTSIHSITSELFQAFESEYSVFCPMSQCFEVFGLDFMLDDQLGVYLLEVNPGPDFQQTGDRLHGVIYQMWEQVCAIVIDSDLLNPTKTFESSRSSSSRSSDDDNNNNNGSSTSGKSSLSRNHVVIDELNADRWTKTAAKDFSLVYSKQWSTAGIKGGMSFTN